MGPKAQGQLLCSFGFNVKESCEADPKDGPGLIKAEMMNGDGVMQLVPECIELTDSQTQAIRKEVTVFLTGFVQCNSWGGMGMQGLCGRKKFFPG